MKTMLVLVALLLYGVPSCATQSYTVPGTANPWLAGMPDGTTAQGGDIAPDQSPVLVAGIVPGSWIAFMNATGGVSYGPSYPLFGPEGDAGLMQAHNNGGEHGKSGLQAPVDSLIGVFLDDNVPAGSLPGALSFASATARDYLTLSPTLRQPFFIGDGLTSAGVQQKVLAPSAATRLFLGTMDGHGWYNNLGQFTVDVVPEPSALLALLCGLGGLVWRRRK